MLFWYATINYIYDKQMMIEPIVALTGLIFSAFFSGTEIAFIQANPLQMEVWQKQGHRSAGRTLGLLAEPERYLTTLLIGTNVANVLTSSFATIAIMDAGADKTITIFIIASVILIFGEIIPKVIFRDHANLFALGVTPLMRIFEFILAPFVKLVTIYSRLLTPNTSAKSSMFTREDLKILFQEKEIGEELESDEKEMITNIFEFGSQPVKEAMTPLSDIVSITIDSTFEDAETVLADTGFSKLPVCDGSPDNIVGVIFLHDLFSNPISLKTIMKKPMFISEKRAASSALEKLKQHTSSIAFITDTIGETVGMVTIEDLVEELFGDFEDIFDKAGKNISRVQGGGLIVDSLVEIDDLKNIGYEIPEGNYETIGGFVISSLGRIPRAGESLNLGKFRAKVLLASPSRLRRIYLTKMPLKTSIPKQP